MAALCFVSFQFCSLKLFFPGRRNVFSCRKCILRTGGSDLGRMVRRTCGSYRNGIRRYSRSGLYYRSAEDVVLKLCIGLIVGLVAHRIAKINESTDKKYIFRWSMIASVAGLGFNVIADPIVGYFYKQYIMGQPQQMAEVLAKWSAATTFVNAVISVILAGVLYNALRPVLLKTGIILQKREEAVTAKSI